MGPVRLLYITWFIVSKCSNKGFYCTRACGTQWGSGSAFCTRQTTTPDNVSAGTCLSYWCVHERGAGCIRNWWGTEWTENESSLHFPVHTKQSWTPPTTLPHGKEPNCPHPSGLLHQARRIDCQKLKEAFISSLTCQSDNWWLLQVQGTLKAHWKLLVTLPGHGLVLSTLLNPKPLQSPASKPPNPGFATCNTELRAKQVPKSCANGTQRVPAQSSYLSRQGLWIPVSVTRFLTSPFYIPASQTQKYFSCQPSGDFLMRFSSLDIHVVIIGVMLTLRQSWVAQHRKAEMLPVPTVGEGSRQLPVQRQHQDKLVKVSKNIQLHPFYLEQTATGQHAPTQDHGARPKRLFPLYFLIFLTNYFTDCNINLGIVQLDALLCPLALPNSGINVQICFEMSSFN